MIGSLVTFVFWSKHQYDDFLISFIINLVNAVIGYLVSKKYFNSDNSTFYKMVYGTMFIRFFTILILMLFLIKYNFVEKNSFFISFVFIYVLFQIFEVNSLIKLNEKFQK